MNGNSRMQKSKKLTVFNDDSWTKYQNSSSCRRTSTLKNGYFGRCKQQQQQQQQQHQHERFYQHQHERWEHIHHGARVSEDPNSGKLGVPVYSNHDAIIGHEFVRQYYTVLYNAPEHLWLFYSERAHYCHENSDGLRVVVTGRSQVRGLLETTVEKGHNHPLVVVKSVSTIRFSPGQLLVMATSEQFIQSFVVEFKTSSKLAVVASIVQYAFTKQTPAPAVDEHETKTGRVFGGCPVPEDRQLFVGHLSRFTTSQHLRRTFGEYGEIVDVRIMSGQNRSGKPSKYNNYAFVVFSRPESLDAAIASQLTELCNGNRVNVQRSKGQRRLISEEYTALDQ